MLKRRKLWQQLSLYFSSFFILFLVMIITLIYQNDIKYSTLDLHDKINTINSLTSITLDDPLWNYNRVGIKAVGDGAFTTREIAKVKIYDINGELLYDNSAVGQMYDDKYLIKTESSIFHGKEDIGHLEIYYTRYYLDNWIKSKFSITGTASLISIILFVIGSVIISRRISSPLTQLENTIQNFDPDEVKLLDINTPIVELESFINSFNRMVENVNESKSKLISLNSELEERVYDRTKQLYETNQTLEQALTFSNETQEKLIDANSQLQSTLESLKTAQDQLIKSEKLAMMGNLVAGVTHEINTPLGVSVTICSFLEQEISNLGKVIETNSITKKDLLEFITQSRESIAALSNNLYRTDELLRSLKRVSVDQASGEMRLFNLKEYLENVVSNLKPKVKGEMLKVDIKLDIDNNIMLYSYPGEISQVFTNLIVNSLIHGFKSKKEGIIKISAIELEKSIDITYQDDGDGIDIAHKDKIFNPFFTTARERGGTGLGLSIIENIITTLLKGQISLESPKDDTVFRIILPKLNDSKDSK